MKHKALLATAAVFILASFVPISTLAAPEWSVCVVDKLNQPVTEVIVRESYDDYASDSVAQEVELYTDPNGCVEFPPQRSSSSLLKRIGTKLFSTVGGSHGSASPHSHVAAISEDKTGVDIRAGTLYVWEGSPSAENSILVMR